MTRAPFMLLHAILALAFGVGFVLAPAPLLALYGVATDAGGTFMARLFGAAAIQIGLVAWLARNDIDTVSRRAVQLGYAGGLAIAFIIAFLGQLAGLFNALGWSTVILFLLLCVGYGYFQARPSAA
jgi:hypothetical protein